MVRNDASITMIGAGGIGSFAMLLLSKLPIGRVTVWDDDRVEERNLVNQLWFGAEVGMNKAEAAAGFLRRSGIDAVARPVRYAGEPCVDDIVVAAVDSIPDRLLAWEGAKKGGVRDALYLDGRLSREDPFYMQLFAIPLRSTDLWEAYEGWLSGEGQPDTGRRDHDMVPAPFVLTGVMGTIMVRWLRGDRALPWQVAYNGLGMTLESNVE